MLLGPKITNITKYGAKTTMRFSLILWLLDRNFAKSITEMVGNAWEGSNDIMTFRTNGNTVMRVVKDDSVYLKISWF